MPLKHLLMHGAGHHGFSRLTRLLFVFCLVSILATAQGLLWPLPKSALASSIVTDLLGDKDGFGLGLGEGAQRPVSLGFFDNREEGDPSFTDVEPVPVNFSYVHSFDLAGKPVVSATLTLFTLGVQDGDVQVFGSDPDIQVFLDNVELPGAFDSVDQFAFDGSQFVEIAGTVMVVPESHFGLLSDGSVEVSFQILQLGTAPSTDAIAIDFSEVNIELTPATPTPVPGLTQWGLIALAGVMATILLWQGRRVISRDRAYVKKPRILE